MMRLIPPYLWLLTPFVSAAIVHFLSNATLGPSEFGVRPGELITFAMSISPAIQLMALGIRARRDA